MEGGVAEREAREFSRVGVLVLGAANDSSEEPVTEECLVEVVWHTHEILKSQRPSALTIYSHLYGVLFVIICAGIAADVAN